MSRSLQKHLSLSLGGAMLLAGLIAATASFWVAYHEAKELQDDMLTQIATLAGNHASLPPSSKVPEQTDHVSDTNHSESQIAVVHLPPDPQPRWLPQDLPPGFHTLNIDTDRFRVFIRDDPYGKRIVVAQPTDLRDEIAIDSAQRTLIPLLLLLPLLIWLMVRIIRKEFAPIKLLSMELDMQSADSPQALADDGLPLEIQPFVNAINRLLNRVNHLIKQQKRFIADAAHELRSPLTALSVQSQNLQKSDTLETARERMIPLQSGIERARLLTEQLLNLARTQSGAVEITEVNLSILARELIAEFLPIAEAKDIDLGLDDHAALPARTSVEGLRQILKNALENALKYTPVGGEVTLQTFSDSENFVIEVVDNGPGIATSEQKHVFDAFYRIPETPGSGSGLGLAIARESAVRLGGTVSLHDRQGMPGLVFRYRQAHGK